jgi:HPt (histidine-containing phosphotransfer) domain-containing protein
MDLMASFSSDDSIDVVHLEQMTLGDASLEREILTMFATQATGLINALAVLPANAGDLAHTLKGSARAIGAFHVASAAENFELALRAGGGASEMLTALELTVAQARTAIDARLRRG